MTPKSARLDDSEQNYDQLNLRRKNCFCAATEGVAEEDKTVCGATDVKPQVLGLN